MTVNCENCVNFMYLIISHSYCCHKNTFSCHDIIFKYYRPSPVKGGLDKLQNPKRSAVGRQKEAKPNYTEHRNKVCNMIYLSLLNVGDVNVGS